MRIVSVSGTCSRAGKTALAVSLLEGLPRGSAAAVKFTTTSDVFERCPRGTACIVCDIDVPYRIVTDPAVLAETGTDTARLLATGARGVVWAIARTGAAGEAWRCVEGRLGGEAAVVLEGSSVVAHARPEIQLFVVHPFLSPERWKPTSPALIRDADLVVVNRPRREPRPPAPEVLDAVAACGGSRLCVADVTEPVARWAPAIAARVASWTTAGARATA